MTVRILVDTSFLLECVKRRVDFLEELERLLDSRVRLLVLKPIYEELKRLSRKRERRAVYARLVLKILGKTGAETLETGKDVAAVDELIVEMSIRMRLPVATNDSKLRKRLRRNGVPVFYLRGLSKIDVDGGEYLGLV